VADKDAENGKCGGRRSYVESRPDTVALAKRLQDEGFRIARSPAGCKSKATERDKVRCTLSVRFKRYWPELTQR